MIRSITTFISLAVMAGAHAAEPEFKSTLFKKGTLVYSDDFDGDYAKEWWGGMKKDKKIEDGKLIITARFKNAEEAKKALKRDHHLGLEPVAHIGKIPEKFVCHLRYKFEAEKLAPNRPVLQIGHHMISFNYLEGGGHQIRLPKGPSFSEPKSGMKLNEWIDLVIEYELGKIHISVNGVGKTIEHKLVTIINPKDKHGPRFTFKHCQEPNSRLVFDHVRLWKAE